MRKFSARWWVNEQLLRDRHERQYRALGSSMDYGITLRHKQRAERESVRLTTTRYDILPDSRSFSAYIEACQCTLEW